MRQNLDAESKDKVKHDDTTIKLVMCANLDAESMKKVKHDYKKIITNEKELKRWLQTMHSYGIAIIQNATSGSVSI